RGIPSSRPQLSTHNDSRGADHEGRGASRRRQRNRFQSREANIWRFLLPGASIGVETCCHGGPKRRTITLTVRESGECRQNLGSGHRRPIQDRAIGRHQMTLTGLIIFLLIGAVAGWLAGRIMHGGFGPVGDIVVGVIGAEIGGWLFGVLGIAVGSLIGSIIAATVGAIILIAVIRLIKRA